MEILVSHTDITTALHGQTFGRNDSFAKVGRIYADYKTTSISANTWATGASVTVPAGTYILIYRAHASAGVIRVGNSSNGGAWSQSSVAGSTAEFIIAMTIDAERVFDCYLFSANAGAFGNGIIAVRLK